MFNIVPRAGVSQPPVSASAAKLAGEPSLPDPFPSTPTPSLWASSISNDVSRLRDLMQAMAESECHGIYCLFLLLLRTPLVGHTSLQAQPAEHYGLMRLGNKLERVTV